MLNTPFKDKKASEEMTKLWTQIFAVAMQQNLPILKTTIYLNDHFSSYYKLYTTEVEVFERIFDELGIQYKYN